MRIAVQIFAVVLGLAGAAMMKVGIGAAAGTRVIGIVGGVVLWAAGAGMFALARKHPALVEAGEKRGEAVMPLGKMVLSMGTLGAIWLYNLAILALLIVLTIRLL